MGVAPGFQATEFGTIPEDWSFVALGTLCSTVTSGSRGWAQYYAEFGELFVRITNLRRSSVNLDLSDSRYVLLPEGNTEGARTSLVEDDLLISITADLGIVAIVPRGLGTAYINQHIALARLTPGAVCPKYVALSLASQDGRRRFETLNDAGSKAGLNLPNVRSVQVSLPPTKAEQEAIAEALSDADALIESLEQLIGKKRLIKQGVMQELLTGKRRLPGFETEPGYQQTEVGHVPQDWCLESIGELFGFKNGLNKAKKFFGHGTPIVNYMDVYSRAGLRRQDIAGTVSVTPDEQRSYSARAGDVFFTRTSETVEEIGTSSVLLEDIEGAVFSGFVLRGRPHSDRISTRFSKYCFASQVVRIQVISTASYTTRALTNGRLLSKVRLPLPPTWEEQEAIASVLSDMDSEVESLEERLQKARLLKSGMMQQLLTGRIRLL